MDFLAHLFLENPIWLGVFSFFLFGFVLFLRRRLESPALRRRLVPGVLGLIVLLFFVQFLVETQREHIQRMLRDFVYEIVLEASGAELFISEAYSSEGMNKSDFLASLRDWFELIDVRDPRFARHDVTIEGDRATMTLGASATVSIRKEAGQTHYGVWTIEWRREDNIWRMISVRPVSIDMQPITSLRSLRGAAGR